MKCDCVFHDQLRPFTLSKKCAVKPELTLFQVFLMISECRFTKRAVVEIKLLVNDYHHWWQTPVSIWWGKITQA